MLGNNLKHVRNKTGLSQKNFGEQFGLTRNQIDSYENGVAEPSLKSMLKIAKKCGYTIEDLISKNVKRLPANTNVVDKEVVTRTKQNVLSKNEEVVTELRSQIIWLRQNNDRLSGLLETVARSAIRIE
ncbi:MAG: transcriptional regulator [Segetibacter sp.]|nr:transcriptional regulator [Segetibacter sp.]